MRKPIIKSATPFIKSKDGSFKLPLLYYNDQSTMSFFTADYSEVKKMLPSSRLEPIRISKNRCVISLVVFNYLHCAIGSYGEFIIGIPALFDRKPLGPLPLLLQSIDPAFGVYIVHCAVTSHPALEAGRREWNVPKFISDMAFKVDTDGMSCALSSDGQRIMDITVPKTGFVSKETRKLPVFTQQNNTIVKFPVRNESIVETAILPQKAELKVYPGHPMSDDWLKLKPSKKPIMTMFLNGRIASMHKGIVIDTNARTWDGHHFLNEGINGKHTVTYGTKTFELCNNEEGNYVKLIHEETV